MWPGKGATPEPAQALAGLQTPQCSKSRLLALNTIRHIFSFYLAAKFFRRSLKVRRTFGMSEAGVFNRPNALPVLSPSQQCQSTEH